MKKVSPNAGQYWNVIGLHGSKGVKAGTGVYVIEPHMHNNLIFVCYSFDTGEELMIHKSDFLLGHLEFVG
jgi:hypothetical protein